VSRFALVLLALAATAARAADPIQPKALRAEVERFIAASKPNRSVGGEGHRAAYEFLKAELKKIGALASAGATLYEHSFRPDVDFAVRSYRHDFAEQVERNFPPEHPEYRKWKAFTEKAIAYVEGFRGKTGRNVILELKGAKRPDEIVYVGAHFDSITHDRDTMTFTPEAPTEGADDNASGVVAMLAVARVVAPVKHERTVRFVAFDYEEVFFLGSHAFARDLAAGKMAWDGAKESLLGYFNLEMVGHASAKRKNPVIKLYVRPDDAHVTAPKDRKLATMLVDAAKKLATRATPLIHPNGFDRSDHWSFWQFGIPAVCITQDWEDDFNEAGYHRAADKVGTINFDYLADVSRILLGGLGIATRSAP
jgi:hypothetical protein